MPLTRNILLPIVREVELHVEILVAFWNSLRLSIVGAKFHIVKDHLVSQLQHWGALGSFNEEFAESDHTRGNSENRTYGSLRCPQTREGAISKRQTVMSNPMVMDCKKEISAAKKRKPMADDKRERVQRRRIEVFFNACVAQCEHSGGLFTKIEDYWMKKRTIDERKGQWG